MPQRLDKLLSQSGERTRSEARQLIRNGLVTVAGQTARDPAMKVDDQAVLLRGQPLLDEPLRYYALHKPAGVLTAASDAHAQTVMDLVPPAFRLRDVLPVGRLDRDTTGLLLLTNDGELAHRLLSPKRHVRKRYEATVEGALTRRDIDAFAAGIALSDFTAKPAEMEIVESGETQSRAVVYLTEGKFHQVKRMFASVGHPVLALHRSSFGPLTLDLPVGECRALRPEEVQALRDAVR